MSAKLTAALRDLQQGAPAVSSSLTVGTALDALLEARRVKLEPSTYQSYAEIIRLHLKPAFEWIKLAQLTPQQVDKLLRDKQQAGLSPRRVQYIRAVLRMALALAEKRGQVVRNVSRLSEPPKVIAREVVAKEPEDVLEILGAIQGDRLAALYTLSALTGLRQGETLGLRWSDLDLANGTLRVSATLHRVEKEPTNIPPLAKLGTVFELRAPKTPESRRVLYLPAELVADLHAHRARQLEEHLRLGPDWNDYDLVFCRVDGRPLAGTWVTKHLQKLLTAAGIDSQRFHDLRHDAANLMHANGDDLKTIQANLGHSTIATTANYYTRITKDTQRRSAERMGKLLARRS